MECGECLFKGCRSHAAYHYGHGVAAKWVPQQVRQLSGTITDKAAPALSQHLLYWNWAGVYWIKLMKHTQMKKIHASAWKRTPEQAHTHTQLEWHSNASKCSVVVWKIWWKRKVSGPVLYVRRELAIIQFCAMVASTRSGFINDVVEWKEVCITQASHSSADAVRQIVQSHMGLNTDLHLDTGNGIQTHKATNTQREPLTDRTDNNTLCR